VQVLLVLIYHNVWHTAMLAVLDMIALLAVCKPLLEMMGQLITCAAVDDGCLCRPLLEMMGQLITWLEQLSSGSDMRDTGPGKSQATYQDKRVSVLKCVYVCVFYRFKCMSCAHFKS